MATFHSLLSLSCFASLVTVAFFANSDPAMVRSGRMKKAFANALQKEAKQLCGLPTSSLPMNSNDELGPFDGRNYDRDKEDVGFEDEDEDENEFSLESGECEGQYRTRNKKKKSKKNPGIINFYSCRAHWFYELVLIGSLFLTC